MALEKHQPVIASKRAVERAPERSGPASAHRVARL
jgi:hypothetical protein